MENRYFTTSKWFRNQCKQTDRSALYCNDNSEIHPVSKISDYKHSDDIILDEFSLIKKSVSEQYIF